MTEAHDRTHAMAAQEGSGKQPMATPETLARSQREALGSTLTPQTIGIVLGEEIARTDEEIFPEGFNMQPKSKQSSDQ